MQTTETDKIKETQDKKLIDFDPENVKVWNIAAGTSDVYDAAWDEFKRNSYIGIGFNFTDDVDYSSFETKDDLKEFVLQYSEKGSLAPGMIWNFAKNIKKGDIVLATKGMSKLAGIGIVTGDFIPKTKNKNPNEFGLNNIIPVKWFFTPDNLEVQKNYFSRNTVVSWKGSYWNPLMFIFARTNEDLKSRLFNYIYGSFINNGIIEQHKTIYDEEEFLVKNVWNNIVFNWKNGERIADIIWNKLVDREIRLHNDGTNNIKSAIQGKHDYTDEEMDRVANLLFETIYNLLNTKDINEQKQILKEYCENEYSKGFRGTGRFSSILYNLNSSFCGINNKSKDTVELFSQVLGDKLTLDLRLENYIDTNEKYKKFFKDLNDTFECDLLDMDNFRTFDTFCHWACDKKLGNIAGKNADFLPFDLFVDIETVLSEIEEDFDELNLSPIYIINSKLQGFSIPQNSIKRLCAALNAGKHIILDGTPGTGKTEIARKFSSASEEKKFSQGFILTTATSDWSTFDTIGGLMPQNGGELYFKPGKFLEAIASNKWLIIDEINRADIDKAFGQLFTVLSGQNVELPYKVNEKPVKIINWDENRCKYDEENATYYIGKNWRIIGTMNVDDKDSLFDLSYAFMRRFMFIELDLPEEAEYKKLIKMWANGLDDYYIEKLEGLYGLVNHRKLGPAIFKDMTEYIKVRTKLDKNDNHLLRDTFYEEDNYKLILSEAIESYIIPQFEGLRKKDLEEIKTFLNEIGFIRLFKRKYR